MLLSNGDKPHQSLPSLIQKGKYTAALSWRHDPSKAFGGFDGNNESEYMALARFMIDKMGMYSWFKGRPLNSHCPSMGPYNRILSAFQKLGSRNMFSSPLSADEIAEVMNARIHPSHTKSHT
ncbi:MAG: YfbU family protein [Plesiomonas shigelloides]